MSDRSLEANLRDFYDETLSINERVRIAASVIAKLRAEIQRCDGVIKEIAAANHELAESRGNAALIRAALELLLADPALECSYVRRNAARDALSLDAAAGTTPEPK